MIEQYFDTQPWDEDWSPRYNIAPMQLVPVIRQHPKEPVRQMSLMRWGLVPNWARDAAIASSTINARSESDIDKLVRDARERSISIAALVARDESQLRQVDRECRWSRKDGVWLLRTTRQWIARDFDLLKPIFERMREQGFDLLEKNAVLANELRRTLPEIDRVEKELGKAAKAIQSVSAMVVRYRERLRDLCDSAANTKIAPASSHDLDNSSTVSA